MKFDLVNGWSVADYGDPANRQTSGLLKILIDSQPATLVIDNRSRTTREEIRVSLYPLAVWFAASWWRLRWEPVPLDGKAPTTLWRMAHEVAAAGCGYSWPSLTFRSDTETMEIATQADAGGVLRSIRYLLPLSEVIPCSQFEVALDSFVELVLARLNDVEICDTELHRLWRDVTAERNDGETACYRRIEAQLGYDPDDAPEGLIEKFMDATGFAGLDAISEIAPTCAGPDPNRSLADVMALMGDEGVKANPKAIRSLNFQALSTTGLPWERGYKLAEATRSALKLDLGPVSDETLADLFEIDKSALLADTSTLKKPPIGLAINKPGGATSLHFHRRLRESRRFEATRFLADLVSAPNSDSWHPVTDLSTARQKLQRAFAAELLCPAVALEEFLGNDFSDERANEAGEYFQVSPQIVTHQVDNHLGSLLHAA